MNHTSKPERTSIVMLSLIAVALFVAIGLLGIGVSLRTRAVEHDRAYSQLQRDVLRLQVLIADDSFDAVALDEQRTLVASQIERLKSSGTQSEMTIQEPVERIDVLWSSAEESFDGFAADPNDEPARAALRQIIGDIELVANDTASQDADRLRQLGEQLMAGLALISILFAAFVGLVIFNLMRLIRERQGADSNLLSTVIDNLPALVYVKDTESRILLVNRAITKERRGGLAPETVMGKTDFDFHPPEIAAKFYADEQEIMRTGTPLINQEELNINLKGESNWYSTTKVPLRNSQGKIIGIVGVSHDITERKRIEEELARERNLLRTVLDNVPDSIFINDTAGRIVLDNLASRRRFAGDVSPEDVIGKTAYDFFPPELAASYLAQDQAILQTGEPLVNDEQMNVDQDGRKHWFLINKVPLCDRDGKVVGIVGIARDITERKLAEQALAKEHNLLRTVIDNLPDPIFIKDMEGRNILNNQADARFAGVASTQELSGKTVYDFFPPEMAAEYHAVERSILDSGQPQINHEEEHVDGHGSKRWFLTTKTPLRDVTGEVIGLVGIARDITDRKHAEQALAEERNLLRTVIDNLPDFIYVKDTESRFLLVNNAALSDRDMTTPDEMLGKNDFDLHPPEIAEKFFADDQQVINSGQPLVNVIEPSINPMTNKERWFSTTKVPLRSSQGKVVGLVGVSRDITKRKHIEDELAKERNLLRTVIDNVPDLIFAKDQDSRFILANQACAEFVGVNTPDELIGKMDFDVESTEAVARYHAQEQALMRSGVSVINQEEFVVVERNGNSMWVSATKVPLRDQDGKIIGLVGVSRDITERKRAEVALAEERNLLRTVIDNLPDLVYVKDSESRFLLVNNTVLKATNLATPEEMIGKSDFDFQPPEIARKYVDDDRALIRSGQPILNVVESNIDPQGKERWLSTTKLPLRNSQGAVIGLVGVSRDITERKRIEDELAKERNLLRTVIDNLPDLIYVRDTESRFVLVNDACLSFVGASTPDELIGKTDFDFYAPDKAREYYAAEQALMHSGQPMRNQDIFVTIPETGKSMWVSATKVPLYDQDGKIAGLVGVSRDITERKRAEEALAEERNLLRTVIDNLPDVIYVKDSSSRYVLRNVTGADLLGLANADEMLGKTDFDFFPEAEAQKFYDEEQAIIQTGQPLVNQETYISYTTGYESWFLVTKVPLRDQDGRITGLVGINRDITDRKHAEQALAEERNLLRTLIDNLPDYVYVKDTEGRWLLRNATGVEEVFGLATPDELLGKTDFDFFPEKLAQRYYDEEQAIIKSGQPIVNRETRVTLTNGASGWLAYTKVPLRDTQGKIVGIVGTTRDITEHKQIEETLAQERNLLRTLIDALPDYVYVKDTTGRFLLRNLSSIERLGVTSVDEVIGKTDFDFFSRELAEKLQAEEQAIIQTGQPVINRELFMTEADGSQRWLQYTKVALRDNQGEIIGIVGVTHDINERKQAEEQLRILSSAVEQSPAAIVITDTQGTIQYVNPKYCALTGYSAAEAITANPRLIQSGETTPETYRQLWETVLRGGEWRGELLNRRKNGETYWVFSSMSPIKNSDGDITHFLAIQEDITERKQAEQDLIQAHDQLEYERAQLEAILDSMGEGVIYDEKHQTRYINQALTALTGYTMEEWHGALHPLKSDSITEEEFEEFNQTIFDSVGRAGIWRGEIRLRRKDGGEFDAGLTCTAVMGSAGQVIGAVTVIRDISQEKALQEQKSRFVANASHELRTPIANLKTRLYLLRKQPEKSDYHLEVMDEVTARMQRLVEDMLDVSRFERGLIPLQLQDVVLQDLMSGVVRVQQAEAERKQIRLNSEFPDEPLHIFADPERVTQVITNLVVNAINYTPEGGQVFVRLAGNDGDATIDIQDTGMGIAADQVHQVFQPFFRASQGVSSGTGLGLSIAKEIVELHGGEIGLESEIGQGACFRVKFALHRSHP